MTDTMSERSVLVAYGSETGNAQDFAEELGHSMERLRYRLTISQLDNISLSTLQNHDLVIVVVSTTGQGELPSNARRFWHGLLRRKLDIRSLENVSFTVFGVGDSSYPKFNWAALKLQKRLIQLGAQEFFTAAMADEQHDEGLDATFVPWASNLRVHLLEKFPLPAGLAPIPEGELLPSTWLLSLVPKSEPDGNSRKAKVDTPVEHSAPVHAAKSVQHSPSQQPSFSGNSQTAIHEEVEVTLRINKRVTHAEHWQDVRQMTFGTPTRLSYLPGDVLLIRPRNPADAVNALIARMQWTEVADQLIYFQLQRTEKAVQQSPLPFRLSPDHSSTLRQMLTNFVDLTAIPRRSFFAAISHFTTDQYQKDRLLEFTMPQYLDELYDYTTRPRRSILEVLDEFDTVRVPWQQVASVFPPLRGRQFSISSGGPLKQEKNGDTRFELLVALVRYRTIMKKTREGVCSRYLANLMPGTRLQVQLQRSNLGLPADLDRPVIMVGPGTGIAPIRSFLWERKWWADHHKSRADTMSEHLTSGLRTSLLFLGCRNKDADFFFKEEWDDLSQTVPLQLCPAFSRDQRQKIYVQDLMRQHSTEIFDLLENHNAIVFVCGSSGKMPQAVRAALVDAVSEMGGFTDIAATKYIESLEKVGRYKQETW